MARAMWSGFLSFGLVNVPVGMYSATADQTVHFNQLHKGTSNRVRYKKVDEATGEELELDDIVNGYEVTSGEYVIVTREELKEAAPGKSDTIEISDFVDLDEIDPIFFRSTYYLAPKGKGADRAYALLRQAMLDANKVGVATVVVRDKEHLVAVRPSEEVLILETMFFDEEIRDPRSELDTLPGEVEFQARELDIARQLIDALSTDWDPARYQNTYRSRIEELIERKREGKAIVYERETVKSNVVDLMAALEASVATTGKRPRVTARAPGADKVAARAVSTTTRVHRAAAPTTKAALLQEARARGLDVDAKATKAELEALLADDEPKVVRGRSRR